MDVEAILDVCQGRKELLFRVAWLGCNNPEEDTWQTRSTIKHLNACMAFMAHGSSNKYAQCVRLKRRCYG
eukprot:4158951-Prymnesium_polylepis.1